MCALQPTERADGRLLSYERRRRIQDLLREQGVASLADIRDVTSASEATVRRDLLFLEKEGFIERTRGGAKLIPQRTSREEEFETRWNRDRREKRMLGKLAAERISDGATVFINDGSTTYAMAQHLRHRHLTVITTALNTAQLLAGYAQLSVMVIGGWLRATSFGTVGPLSAETIRGLHADVAILGVDGVTLNGGVSEHNIEDSAVAKAMSVNAARTIVIASPGKVGMDAQAHALDWRDIDELVTMPPPLDLARGLRQLGVRIVSPREDACVGSPDGILDEDASG